MAPRNLNFIQRLFDALGHMLRRPPRVSWKDFAVTLILVFVWVFLIHARPWIIDTRCANDPFLCNAQSVPAIDRYALEHDSAWADDLSYKTQGFSAYWAYLVPFALQAGRIALISEPLGAALSFAIQDTLLISQTIVLNGTFNELARLIVQRPRPFVYRDPGNHGSNPQNYTSFYSGHTSFVTASNCALFFVMMGRGAGQGWMLLLGILGPALIFATGLLRILSGRHFPTDVLCGALAGAMIALGVALKHRALKHSALKQRKLPDKTPDLR